MQCAMAVQWSLLEICITIFGTHAQSLAASVKAGVDAMSDPMPVVEEATREALEYGLLSEDEMDEAIRNVFRTKLKLGMFDDTVQNPYDRVTEKDLCSNEAQKNLSGADQKNQLFFLKMKIIVCHCQKLFIKIQF